MPSSGGEILNAYRKMRFAQHERPTYWWMKATKYGLRDDILTPLYGMEIASIFKVQEEAAGFVNRSLEIVYSTDLATGELLKEWKNPYTGETLPIKNVPVGPNTVRYTEAGPELPTSLPGASTTTLRSVGSPASSVARTSVAARIIPSLTSPRIFRGSRFATITT